MYRKSFAESIRWRGTRKGKTLAEITAELNEVAEGINTARAVKKLADRAGLEMPITNEVNAVLTTASPHATPSPN